MHTISFNVNRQLYVSMQMIEMRSVSYRIHLISGSVAPKMSIFEVTVAHLLLGRRADSLEQGGSSWNWLFIFRVWQWGRTDVLQARARGTGVLLAALGAACVRGNWG